MLMICPASKLRTDHAALSNLLVHAAAVSPKFGEILQLNYRRCTDLSWMYPCFEWRWECETGDLRFLSPQWEGRSSWLLACWGELPSCFETRHLSLGCFGRFPSVNCWPPQHLLFAVVWYFFETACSPEWNFFNCVCAVSVNAILVEFWNQPLRTRPFT